MDAMDNLADEDGSGKTPFMRFWISDWQSSVVLMTAAQRGAHISMLAYSWERGGCPTDLTLLKRLTGEIDDADLRVVLERWEIVNGQYINPRQERERRAVRLRHDRAVRAAGRRWSNAQSMLEPMLDGCSGDAAQSPRVSESHSSDAQNPDAHILENKNYENRAVTCDSINDIPENERF
jgi:uncharacterized protein YdaU (DUF1376 family)